MAIGMRLVLRSMQSRWSLIGIKWVTGRFLPSIGSSSPVVTMHRLRRQSFSPVGVLLQNVSAQRSKYAWDSTKHRKKITIVTPYTNGVSKMDLSTSAYLDRMAEWMSRWISKPGVGAGDSLGLSPRSLTSLILQNELESRVLLRRSNHILGILLWEATLEKTIRPFFRLPRMLPQWIRQNYFPAGTK